RVPFETISREDRLNEEVIQTLARMGCYRLWIGAESGSQRVLDAMKRRTNAERVRSMVHLLQKYGIEVGMFIMLGYEGEERTDLEETVEHLKLAGPNTFLTTVAYPIKGTPYYASVADRVVSRRAPPPVVAPLVPRCALLPAASPRLARPPWTVRRSRSCASSGAKSFNSVWS